jgi:Divergent InlB B-repeat domain
LKSAVRCGFTPNDIAGIVPKVFCKLLELFGPTFGTLLTPNVRKCRFGLKNAVRCGFTRNASSYMLQSPTREASNILRRPVVNTKSNERFHKILYGMMLAGMMFALVFGLGGRISAHAQQAAVLDPVYLPLVLRGFPLINPQTLTVDISGTGSGAVISNPSGIDCGLTCSAAFSYNTSVTLTAEASPGSTFAGWSDTGCPGTGTCVVTMTAARSVSATFTINTYQLTISKSGTGSGSITSSPPGINCGSTCSFSFPYNTVVTLSATPIPPSTFAGWNEGVCSGMGTCQVTMNADQQAMAVFTLPCSGSGIVNCDFELGPNVGWTEYSSQVPPLAIIWNCAVSPCNPATPHSGNYLAWLGAEDNETSYIQQQVTIAPAAPFLVYWQWIDSADECGLDLDYAEVLINGVQVEKYDLCTDTSTSDWVPHNLSLASYAGQSVTLQIRAYTAYSSSSLYIDDVSLQVSPLTP